MPPNKKQKIDAAPPPPALPPISFDVPGLPADVSLNVFGQEFLVHSAVLMLHSGFFRQYLYAPSKERVLPRSAGDVSLQWVTQAYPKDWHLIARTSNWAQNYSSFTGDILHQQKSSEKLICALYNRPYVIGDIYELETMVLLAKDWSMLPILSRTIDSIIWRSYDFTDTMHLQPLKVLQLATWLRNHLLFRDSLCHAAGTWTASKEEYRMEDANLYTIVDTHHRKLTTMVTETQQELLNVIYNEESEDGKRGPLEQKMHQIIKDGDYNKKNAPPLPTYFRKLHDEGVLDCTSLLKSNLVLDGGYQKAGLGNCQDRFLCAWIDTEDLPWDSRVVIW